MTLRTLLAATSVTAALLLTGCSGAADGSMTPTPTTSTQTIADACTVVRTSVADAAAQLQQLDPSNPQAAGATMSRAAEELGAAVSAVANPDVAALLPGLQSGFTQAAAALGAIAGGDLSKLPALQQATSDIQSSFADFAALCPAP